METAKHYQDQRNLILVTKQIQLVDPIDDYFLPNKRVEK